MWRYGLTCGRALGEIVTDGRLLSENSLGSVVLLFGFGRLGLHKALLLKDLLLFPAQILLLYQFTAVLFLFFTLTVLLCLSPDVGIIQTFQQQ